MIDVDDLGLDKEWSKVQRRSGVDKELPPAPSSFRVGRILARPGDTVTFRSDGRTGLAINGAPIEHKAAGMIDLVVRGRPDPSESSAALDSPRSRGSAYEMVGGRRFRVLATPGVGERWPAMRLPSDPGPVEIVEKCRCALVAFASTMSRATIPSSAAGGDEPRPSLAAM